MNLLNLSTALLTVLLPLFGESDTKSWQDYKLTVGPKRPTESGRYVYNASIGGRVHCHYCERRALIDSTYSFLQQKRCIANYRQNESINNQVSKEEREEELYPICVKGTVPVCGPPPEDYKTIVYMWQCDPGYSNQLHSVYFSCALVCNRTDQVERSYYCNESLKWDAEQYMRPSQPCELTLEPVVAREDSQMVNMIIYLSVAFGVVVVVVISTVVLIIWRKKKRKTPAGPEPDPDTEEGNGLLNNARVVDPPVPIVDDALNVDQSAQTTPNSSLTSRTPSSLQDSYSNETSDLRRPLIHDASTGTDSSSHGEEGDGEGAMARSPHLKIPVDIPTTTPSKQHTSDKPDIKIICWKGHTNKHSVPMQGGHYSIEKGLDFHIIPNSTGGHSVREFKVERKGEGRPFRGKLELQLWNTVYCATEYDAGLFTWKMKLDNSSTHEGSFEIYIMLPDLSSRERPETLGMEGHRPPPRVNDMTGDVPHLDVESVLSDKNVDPVRHQCRAEIHTEVNPSLLWNAPLLSSNLYNELNYTDLGFSSGNRNLSRNRMNSNDSRNLLRTNSGHLDNNRARSEDITDSTSGYVSQISSERNLERYNANIHGVPKLNVESIESGNMSSNSLSGNKLQHNPSDLLSKIPEHANDEQFRDELHGIATGKHDKSFEDLVDDLQMDESFGDQVDGITSGTHEEPFEDQLDAIPLSGRPDPVGHASEAPCGYSCGTDENTRRKELVASEYSEANGAVPTIEHHGAGPTTEQHSAVPTMVQQHVPDTEHNHIDTNDQIQPRREMLDSFEIELQDYNTVEPAERNHESRM